MKSKIKNLKVSVCITIFNESKETVKSLLDALNSQTLKPDEIIMVDASASPISNQFSNSNLQLLHRAGVSRAEGRNIAIKQARNEIIAITDAGCVPDRNWLYEIIKLFSPTSPKATKGADVVSGGYRMIAENSFQQAESIFLGVKSSDMSDGFMPSARSMAFTKTIWKKAGGFPEKLGNTAEDTLFNVELLKVGAKFVTAKKAIVDWYLPNNIRDFALKIYGYAKGDAESNIWWHPVKKWRTHNLKIMTVFARYVVGLLLFALIFQYTVFTLYLYILISLYLLFAFIKARIWGIVLQFISDFAVMAGFLRGILKLCVRI
jgi:cellulose synthase/poly-beta-1,6-N-acetylglucosamine synthase-like glycosyltransferase